MLPFDPTPSNAIVNHEVDRMVRQVVRYRASAAPVFGAILAYLAWFEGNAWRHGALVVVLSLGFVGMVWSQWRATNAAVEVRELKLSVLATGPLQLAVFTLTGGLDSPLLIFLAPFVALTALLFGASPWLTGLLTVQLLWLVVVTVVQAFDLSAMVTMEALGEVSSVRQLMVAATIPPTLLVSAMAGLTLRARLYEMVEAGLRSRERQLESLVAHSRDLELAGGELAHELKNPLASIQGLAMLVSRGLSSDPKNAERMEVLEGEVKRMTSIVDDFLTWSRPMTPLTRRSVDCRQLLDRMRVLHEGMGLAAGVEIVCSGTGLMVDADERKLEQILVNLLQNALSATARETRVELSVQRQGTGVRFEVADRGPGIAAELADRVFEPGVTSRPEGSGLGLTVARMLARQHDGELALSAREGGGTVASLELP